MLTITSGDGARVVVHRDGAQVTSWLPAGSDDDRLFVSASSGFGPGVSIRGGIPVIFPQFGAEGTLPRHGFARTMPWTVVNAREGADAAYHATVTGLQGCDYRDALRDRQVAHELPPSLAIPGEIDRVYFDVTGALEVRDDARVLRIEKRGFPDAVVWNPGASGTRGRADFEPGDEHHMLCVEAAAVQRPIVLASGARWEGTQIMTAVR
mgnify:CR=1 FL=1